MKDIEASAYIESKCSKHVLERTTTNAAASALTFRAAITYRTTAASLANADNDKMASFALRRRLLFDIAMLPPSITPIEKIAFSAACCAISRPPFPDAEVAHRMAQWNKCTPKIPSR